MPQGERTVEERAEPETAAPEPLAAPQAAPPARVLALQRQAGNQAVAAMLSPSPPRIARLQTREDLDRQYHGHLNERPPNWDDAARDLNGFNDADVRERVRDLDPDQLDPMKAASERVNGASAHRIRTPILERQWRTAVQRRNWRTAATYLNGFNHEDIDRLLGAMDPDDLMHLDDEVLKTDYPLISAQAAPIRTAGEPRRLADLDRRYRDAVGRKDWRQAAELLNTYNDADIERLAGEFTDTEELQQFGRVALVSFQLRVVAGIGAVLSRPPHAERVRLQILEADWADARRAGDFTKMAILSRQFSPPEMENHLLTLHLPELEGLVEQTRGLGAILYPALVEPAERHRARKHLEMTRFAIDNSQWWYAVTLLNGLSPADIITWVDGLTAPQFSAIQPLVYIRYNDSNPLFRRVNYRMNLPALAGAHPTSSSGVTANAGDPSVAVPGGGTVTTHANDAGGAGWFGQDYQGPNAQQVGLDPVPRARGGEVRRARAQPRLRRRDGHLRRGPERATPLGDRDQAVLDGRHDGRRAAVLRLAEHGGDRNHRGGLVGRQRRLGRAAGDVGPARGAPGRRAPRVRHLVLGDRRGDRDGADALRAVHGPRARRRHARVDGRELDLLGRGVRGGRRRRSPAYQHARADRGVRPPRQRAPRRARAPVPPVPLPAA